MPSNQCLLKSISGGVLAPPRKLRMKQMREEELQHKLLMDLSDLNLPTDEVSIEIRPYSKSYFGRYIIKEKRILIYPYASKNGQLYSYNNILCTAIHEMVHHIQHQDPNFKRKKGVMHDTQFWRLYNHFLDRVTAMGILSESEVRRKK